MMRIKGKAQFKRNYTMFLKWKWQSSCHKYIFLTRLSIIENDWGGRWVNRINHGSGKFNWISFIYLSQMNFLELRKKMYNMHSISSHETNCSINWNWNGTFINSLKNLINFKFKINNTTDKTITFRAFCGQKTWFYACLELLRTCLLCQQPLLGVRRGEWWLPPVVSLNYSSYFQRLLMIRTNNHQFSLSDYWLTI